LLCVGVGYLDPDADEIAADVVEELTAMRVRKTNRRGSPTPVIKRRAHATYPGRSHSAQVHKRERHDDAVPVGRDGYIIEEVDGTWSFACRTCRLTIIGWADEDRAKEQHAIHERTPGHAALARRA